MRSSAHDGLNPRRGGSGALSGEMTLTTSAVVVGEPGRGHGPGADAGRSRQPGCSAPAQQSARHQMPAFHRRTDRRLNEEPSPALLAVASPSASPSIVARQPRSAQSCCATAPAATRRVEVVVLAVISILLFALSFRMFTGLFRRRTYCAAANGTRLSANRSAQGMNSTSSNWGTSGGQPVSSNSGRLAHRRDLGGEKADRSARLHWSDGGPQQI